VAAERRPGRLASGALAPKNGDGDGHLEDGFLIVRNMLPAASFDHAVQDTTTPGDEAAVMGAYYPRGTYTTRVRVLLVQERVCERVDS
jgi:hypothetical protein